MVKTKTLFTELANAVVRRKKMIEIIAMVVVCVSLASFGQIYMKKGLNEVGGIRLNELLSMKIFSTVFNPSVFLGVVLYMLAAVLWLAALSMGNVSFMYPLMAIGYLLTAVLARFYFSESITPLRWLAILAIIGGVLLLMKS